MTATEMKPEQQRDPEAAAFARCLAAGKALTVVLDELELDFKRAKSSWTEKLATATKTYREVLRDEDVTEKITNKRARELYFKARDLLFERDALAEKAKGDKDERKRRIAKFELAVTELWAISNRDAGQLELIVGSGEVDGLAWASKESREIVYSALMRLAAREDFDRVMVAGGLSVADEARGLLADMASSGVGTIVLGFDAAQAIETEIDEDERPEVDEDDGDEFPV